MKIVDRKTFLSMPAGTLFSKYVPMCFGELCIKESTLGENDFLVQHINDAIACGGSDEFASLLDDAERNGTSLAMDFDALGRDGCFDADQLFAVWERDDVEALIARLQTAISRADKEAA